MLTHTHTHAHTHTQNLKRAARNMEHNWKKTKVELFHISWKESSIEALKARSAYCLTF